MKWESELFLFFGKDRRELIEKIHQVINYIQSFPQVPLKDISYTLNKSFKKEEKCLAIVSSTIDDLQKKLTFSIQKLQDTMCNRIKEKTGIYYFENSFLPNYKLAFLFPGEGAQYQNMLIELCLHFPEVRKSFDLMEQACGEEGFMPSNLIFPTSDKLSQNNNEESLWSMELAVESVTTADNAGFTLLQNLNIKPDFVVGHSSGEFASLEASGISKFETDNEKILAIRDGYQLIKKLSKNRDIPEVALIAVGGIDRTQIDSVIAKFKNSIFIAMENCPHQYILCSLKNIEKEVTEFLISEGGICTLLPFDRPYHTKWFEPALSGLKEFFEKQKVYKPEIPVFSCCTGEIYPDDPESIRNLAVEQWAKPVKFQKTIENMYEKGVRVFVEVGPGSNLTSFVDDILRGKDYISISLDKRYRNGINQLNNLLGLLASNGVSMNLDYLYKYRNPSFIDFKENVKITTKEFKLQTSLPEIKLTNISLIRPNKNQINVDKEDEEIKVSEEVMKAYLDTMEKFLSVQKDIVNTFLSKSSFQKEHIPLQKSNFPMLGEIIEIEEGKSLIAIRKFNIDEDVFLKDHTFGTKVSVYDEELKALPVMPLVMSIEICAEAATFLIPGKVVVGIKNLLAHRWIIFEDEDVILRIIAKRNPDNFNEVDVKIIDEKEYEKIEVPLVECTIILGDSYQQPKKIKTIPLENPIRVDWEQKDIYPKRLFHGKKFQAVSSVFLWGENGIDGIVKILPFTDFFRSIPEPQFAIDPLLIDNIGQGVGIWSNKELYTGTLYLPFRAKQIHFFGPPLMPGESLTFQWRVLQNEQFHLVVDICAIDSEGNTRVYLENWEDRGWYVSNVLHKFFLEPIEFFVAEPYLPIIEKLSSYGNFVCCIISNLPEGLFQQSQKIWQKVMAFLIFNRDERNYWKSFKGSEKRKIEYLIGRAVAKDTIRLYLQKYYGLKLGPSDIIIENNDKGKPIVKGKWTEEINTKIEFSISHTEQISICVAGEPKNGNSLGIDIEVIKDVSDDFLESVFSKEERNLICSDGIINSELSIRLWCAKEAVGKALGIGVKFSPKEMIIKDINLNSGDIKIQLTGKWSQEFSFLENKQISVYTFTKDKTVIGVCIL